MISTVEKNKNLNPPLDVSGLTLGTLSTFIPPTNKPSLTSYQAGFPTCVSTTASHVSFNHTGVCSVSHNAHHPWLPISKGNIKKFAQTRFVNSSPNSYRLMPASVETSDLDKTSFVEKSSQKSLLPVSYFLEVAKLWALSNRSELECTFTLANTDDSKTSSAIELISNNDKRRPICHIKQSIQNNVKSTEFADISAAEKELLQSINRFLETCDQKDKSSNLNPVLSDNIGSETRRYLSQIISLTNKNFALKLQNSLNPPSSVQNLESRKRSSSLLTDESCPKRTKETSCVNIFTVPSTELDRIEDDKILIIHIPPAQQDFKHNSSTVQNLALKKRNGLTNKDEMHKCFYCQLSFSEKLQCAKHMLLHLNGGETKQLGC